MSASESPQPDITQMPCELRLATVGDLLCELKRRHLRFVFVGFEDTNSKRAKSSWMAGRAANRRQHERLSRLVAVALRELKHQQDESQGNE